MSGLREHLRVSVVVPVRDDAMSVSFMLRQLPEVHEVVLVDGGSADGTVEAARHARPDVKVVTHTTPGRVSALAAGVAVATGDVVVTLPLDGSADPCELDRYVAALAAGADFVKGSRVVVGGGSAVLTPLRLFVIRSLSWLAHRLLGTPFSDITHGSYGLWREHAHALAEKVTAAGLPWPEDARAADALLAARIAGEGLRVVEVPSTERPRLFGVHRRGAVRCNLRVIAALRQERRMLAAVKARQGARRARPAEEPAPAAETPAASAAPAAPREGGQDIAVAS